MRLALVPLTLILAACGTATEEPVAPQETGDPGPAATGAVIYAGAGRDRLCLDRTKGRAGVITYGQGDRNCSIAGAAQQSGNRVIIVPDGDQSCRVEAVLTGSQLQLGAGSSACAYYCAPGASFAGKTFRREEGSGPVTDLAGDPLC